MLRLTEVSYGNVYLPNDYVKNTSCMHNIIPKSNISSTKILMSLFFGFILGAASGLTGVGGGEFRIPVLLHVLGLSVVTVVTVNLFVGLVTVVASFLRRFQLLGGHATNITLFMSIGSTVGAYIGTLLTGKIPECPLKKLLAVVLIVVGLKVGLEPIFQTPTLQLDFTLDPWCEGILAFLIGLSIGIISGTFGVAGGEFRIPVLIYLFGLDIKIAGTTSLLVSIPTVATGFIKHHQLGHIDQSAVTISVAMGVGSVFGAIVGASYVEVIEKEILKVLLGAILILATVRMVTKP